MYEKQWERAKRLFDRFTELNDGKQHDRDSINYEDDVLSFFMHCYHVKDWLINDPAFNKGEKEIERFVTATDELAIVADVCNGIKHLKRKKKKTRSGHEATPGRRHINFNASTNLISIKITIEHGDDEIDAYMIASEAMDAWQSFIEGNG